MTTDKPTTTRAWQYSQTSGGLENHIKLNTVPIPTPKPDQHLIRVLATPINPVDYKLSEIPVLGGFIAPRPATPGLEIAGEIVVPASGSSLVRGQLVCGSPAGGLAAAGGLAEFVLANQDAIVATPEGISATDAAALPVAAVTSYSALVPYVKSGDHVLFNGGSGGVGVIAIQLAKILGCHVTVTCSSRNAELCKSLGADEVVDYTKGDLIDSLKKLGYKFNHIIDGVGNDKRLFWKCDQYTEPGAKLIYIAFSPPDVIFVAQAKILPTFLGGQSRELVVLFAEMKGEALEKMVAWVHDGKIKSVIDSKYQFDQVPDAIRKVKTGRARGKVVVDVAKQDV